MVNKPATLAGVVTLLLITGCDDHPRRPTDANPKDATSYRLPPVSHTTDQVRLTVQDVLAWRDTYGDLLDRPRDAAIERFQSEGKRDGTNGFHWAAGPRTDYRSVGVFCVDRGGTQTIFAVRVHPKTNETMDVLGVIRLARQFTFGSGTFTDSVDEYFSAETVDRRNSLTFAVHGDDITFHSAVFASDVVAKERRER